MFGTETKPAQNVTIAAALNAARYNPNPRPKSPIWSKAVKIGSYNFDFKYNSPGSAFSNFALNKPALSQHPPRKSPVI
jgi:hypothetical protein